MIQQCFRSCLLDCFPFSFFAITEPNFQMWYCLSCLTGAWLSAKFFFSRQSHSVLYFNQMICQKLNTLTLLLSIIPSFHLHLHFFPNQGLFFIVPFSLSASTRQNVLAASSNKVSYSHDRKRFSFQRSSSSGANQVRLLFGSVRAESWKRHTKLLKRVWNTTLLQGTSVQLKTLRLLKLLQRTPVFQFLNLTKCRRNSSTGSIICSLVKRINTVHTFSILVC